MDLHIDLISYNDPQYIRSVLDDLSLDLTMFGLIYNYIRNNSYGGLYQDLFEDAQIVSRFVHLQKLNIANRNTKITDRNEINDTIKLIYNDNNDSVFNNHLSINY